MASNVAVRAQQYEFGKHCLLGTSFFIISALADFFEDKEPGEERRKQMAVSFKQNISQAFSVVLHVVAGILASGLNMLLLYVTHFLRDTGIQDGLPINTVTPEGVIVFTQWVFLLLICYGVITLAFVLVTFFLRWLWWLLKVGVALACFGLILNDHSVDIKTMVLRLLCLGCVCIVLSIRPWKDQKTSENRVKGMNRWRRGCIILSCCLIVFLCFMVFMVFYTAVTMVR